MNVLLEGAAPEAQWAVAPRYASVALTNACELACAYCYAPKHSSRLLGTDVIRWAHELDTGGCLGVGFGGGEPTLHPDFVQICTAIAASTALAVTFTTHGHRLTEEMAAVLRGSVHFIRVSVDGVGDTYERLRGRPFAEVQRRVAIAATVSPIGINVVVNRDTLGELDDIVGFAESAGAAEVLLLPEQPTSNRPGLASSDRDRLVDWILHSSLPVRLAIARSGLESQLPVADPFPGEHGLEAHVHLDASGLLRADAYSAPSVPVGTSILEALETLKGRA